MEGCPYCHEIRGLLDNEGIRYTLRDINKNESEYDLFVKMTGNEYVPSFLLMEINNNEVTKMEALVPDDGFQTLEDRVEKVKRFLE